VTGGGVTDERGRVVFGLDAGPLSGLTIVAIADSRGTLRFSLPVWQTAGDPVRFEFPRMGGADRLWALDLWGAITHRLFAGQGAPVAEPDGE